MILCLCVLTVLNRKNVRSCVTRDNNRWSVNFSTHIEYICRMAKCKLCALQRIRNYLSTEKARLLATAFINSQFYYAPLIWMFAGKSLISKVQKIHFRTLQVVYNTYEKSYNELLILNRDISIHQKHLHFLATEVY